ncbi:hypothetical protein [Propionimicrobium sp. PCR01-08-3]|uniref:hypothetical protein n=1 Tax=Propionimicrobium sp. PCR01-08-3 TaxID=3052086 RepID=UPI00255CD2FF|nr:hypothetical protein [Propionimicrobium sp. PCR01-08-3]WIY84328.1 hypothetical protein QQ658_15060 [Propionimicrobium sp. PCR01-08-3]
MRIAVGVVAVLSRLEQAMRLSTEVGAEVLQVDDGGYGERVNHQETLRRLAGTGADVLVMLEDDAIPCTGFRSALDDYLVARMRPEIVSLYLGTGRWAGTSPSVQGPRVQALIDRADARGDRWIFADALWHAVGLAIPQCIAGSLLDYLAGDPSPTDEAITHWARKRGEKIAYTHPSLVDHRDDERVVDQPEDFVPRHAIRFRG